MNNVLGGMLIRFLGSPLNPWHTTRRSAGGGGHLVLRPPRAWSQRQPFWAAAALYLRTPDDPEYRLSNIAVLHIADGKIAELTGFDATDKPWLGLPPTL